MTALATEDNRSARHVPPFADFRPRPVLGNVCARPAVVAPGAITGSRLEAVRNPAGAGPAEDRSGA
ncbi:MAG: hypothetical protein ACLFTU_01955 [Puniceicoccaceae bacterium]